MKMISCLSIVCLLWSAGTGAQSTERTQPHGASQASAHETMASPESNDVEQMRADLDRLKVVLNQMRTNLAFVQTSQTPLKHQFELETDAWQVIVEQMDRRLK